MCHTSPLNNKVISIESTINKGLFKKAERLVRKTIFSSNAEHMFVSELGWELSKVHTSTFRSNIKLNNIPINRGLSLKAERLVKK